MQTSVVTVLPEVDPIPGTRKPERLEENLGAVHIELTPHEMRALEDARSGVPNG